MSTGSPRQLWLLPVLLITVIATAVGGLLARDLYTVAPSPPAVVAPSTVPSGEQPGPAVVQGTGDAVAHPLYATLQPVLQRYFEAINAKDYAGWASVVTSERQANQPEETWRKDFRTTRDGNIVMHRIEARGGGVARVLLTFTSTQDVADAPGELPSACIHWNVVWAFATEDGEWKLAAGPAAAVPQHEAC